MDEEEEEVQEHEKKEEQQRKGICRDNGGHHALCTALSLLTSAVSQGTGHVRGGKSRVQAGSHNATREEKRGGEWPPSQGESTSEKENGIRGRELEGSRDQG